MKRKDGWAGYILFPEDEEDKKWLNQRQSDFKKLTSGRNKDWYIKL